jgi:N-carbamoylputrescine amidase
MKDTLTVAAVAASIQTGEIRSNLDALRDHAQRAAARGAELVLFPELSVSGFLPNHPTGDHARWLADTLRGAWSLAQPFDGEAVHGLCAISKEAGVFVAAGFLERRGSRLFNTHVLAGEGRVWGYWRKMHIPLFEMQVFAGGDVPMVADTPLGRIGANICFDAFLPESTRLLAVQDAELVLFPFAADPPPFSPEGWYAWAQPVLQARCAENGVFGIACNLAGRAHFAGISQDFAGGAAIFGPDGKPVTELAGDIAVAQLSRDTLDAARAAFEYTLRFRRPELYGSLARHDADGS